MSALPDLTVAKKSEGGQRILGHLLPIHLIHAAHLGFPVSLKDSYNAWSQPVFHSTVSF